jgi:hypothetical protein
MHPGSIWRQNKKNQYLDKGTFLVFCRWFTESTLIDNRAGDNWPMLGVRVGTPLHFVITARYSA